jgi:hypothetical protein
MIDGLDKIDLFIDKQSSIAENDLLIYDRNNEQRTMLA